MSLTLALPPSLSQQEMYGDETSLRQEQRASISPKESFVVPELNSADIYADIVDSLAATVKEEHSIEDDGLISTADIERGQEQPQSTEAPLPNSNPAPFSIKVRSDIFQNLAPIASWRVFRFQGELCVDNGFDKFDELDGLVDSYSRRSDNMSIKLSGGVLCMSSSKRVVLSNFFKFVKESYGIGTAPIIWENRYCDVGKEYVEGQSERSKENHFSCVERIVRITEPVERKKEEAKIINVLGNTDMNANLGSKLAVREAQPCLHLSTWDVNKKGPCAFRFSFQQRCSKTDIECEFAHSLPRHMQLVFCSAGHLDCRRRCSLSGAKVRSNFGQLKRIFAQEIGRLRMHCQDCFPFYGQDDGGESVSFSDVDIDALSSHCGSVSDFGMDRRVQEVDAQSEGSCELNGCLPYHVTHRHDNFLSRPREAFQNEPSSSMSFDSERVPTYRRLGGSSQPYNAPQYSKRPVINEQIDLRARVDLLERKRKRGVDTGNLPDLRQTRIGLKRRRMTRMWD